VIIPHVARDVIPYMENRDYSTCCAHIVLMFRDCDLSVSAVYDQIAALTSGLESKMCVGVCGVGNVLVYIRKNDQRPWKSLEFTDATGRVVPEMYRFKSRGVSSKTMGETLIRLSRVLSETETDLVIVTPREGEFSFEQLYSAFVKLSPSEKISLKGRCEAVPVKKRNDFETTLLRCYPTLAKAQTVKEKVSTVVFNAARPPWPVCPLECLINMDENIKRKHYETNTKTKKMDLGI
jgi:hypothetical protein